MKSNRLISLILSGALLLSSFSSLPASAKEDTGTNSRPQTEAIGEPGSGPQMTSDVMGEPEFSDPLGLLEAYDLDPEVCNPEENILKGIFDKDAEENGYYMDRVLQRPEVVGGSAYTNGNGDGNTFMTRGRTLYVYTSDPTVIGSGGKTAYHQFLGEDMYKITFRQGGEILEMEEDTDERLNIPSCWSSVYTGGDLSAKVSKSLSVNQI